MYCAVSRRVFLPEICTMAVDVNFRVAKGLGQGRIVPSENAPVCEG